MAGWRDQLRPGSFRGVAFFVEAHEAEAGRRTAVHEYPGRDKPWAEDLGRKARMLTLDAFVLGADYMTRRDQLLAAVEAPGAGQLVHPWLGELLVTVLDCKLSESTSQGGLARFTLKLVEAGEATWPRVAASTPDQVAAKADPAFESANAAFQARYNTRRQPDFVAASASQILGGLASQVRAAAATVRSALAPLAELQRQVDAFQADLVSIVYEPASVAQAAAGMVQQLVRSVATLPADALSLARTLWRFGPLQVDFSGASGKRAVELANQVELARLVRSLAIAEAARAAAEVSFGSFDEASALRDEFTEVIDELLYATVDDAAFDAMRALRTAVVADIAVRGADLARLVRHTSVGTMPALVLAQRLYADADRADELARRNRAKVVHPLFVPGGIELEVLADA